MVPISHPVRRSVATGAAGSVDATLSGNGGTPITGADVVGGLTTKTIAFAAGETLKYASWDLIDDGVVEGTEGYKVTLSNPQPNGTMSVPSITGTVGDSGGSAPSPVIYDATAADTGTKKSTNRVTINSFVNSENIGIYITKGSNGTSGLRLLSGGDGFLSINRINADGSDGGVTSTFNFASVGRNFTVNGQPMPIRLEIYSNRIDTYINDSTDIFRSVSYDFAVSDLYLRRVDNTAARTIMTNVS